MEKSEEKRPRGAYINVAGKQYCNGDKQSAH